MWTGCIIVATKTYCPSLHHFYFVNEYFDVVMSYGWRVFIKRKNKVVWAGRFDEFEGT